MMRRPFVPALWGVALLLFACETPVQDPKPSKPTYVLKADKYEDKDASAFFTSNVLKLGPTNTQWHSIYDENHSAADIDYYHLSAVAGSRYRIATLSYRGDTVDTLIELKDATAKTLATSDDANGTLAVIDWWECPATGIYVLQVTGRAVGYYGITADVFEGAKVTAPYSQNFEVAVTTPWNKWRLDDTVIHGGLWSLRTAAVSSGRSTSMQLLVEVPAGGKTLSYYWKVNSEPDKDLFRFSVDGAVVSTISGSQGWAQVTQALTAGTHMLQWEYSKSKSGATTYDSGWLDDLTIQ